MNKFTYGSVCSGIESVSCAWGAFAKCEWLSEIEKFPSEVLKYHFPDVPNLGDMTKIKDKILAREVPAPDVLVGGTPCQAFSVAGARQSLDDERGQLTLAFVELANAIDTVREEDGKQPCIILWENVPGVLNTKDNAFGCLLAGLAQEDSELQPPRKRWGNVGYIGGKRQVAWRILDSQYFGVPQRRRRVFVVASARGGANFAEVLFERKSLPRDVEQSGKTECDVATFTESCFAGYSQSTTASTLKACGGVLAGGSENFVLDQHTFSSQGFARYEKSNICATLTARGIVAGASEVLILGSAQPNAMMSDNTVPTLTSSMGTGGGHVPMVTECYNLQSTANMFTPDKMAPTLLARMGTGGNNVPVMPNKHGLRKLTPVECERLQGFPDNWTQIPWRGKDKEQCPDSPRYKAIGNSMTVNVMRFIGERIGNFIES